VAYSFDNTSKNMKTYVNGNLSNTTQFLGFTPTTGGTNYRIGTNYDGAANFIIGELGQILIYSRALADTEVLQNYAASSNTFSV
jgi:hypothetical protein